MKINLKATGIELTPAISSYVEKKILPVEKFIAKSDEAIVNVEVGKTSDHHKGGDIFRAEVHITGPGLDIYAVTKMDDLYAAIDVVKDEVMRTAVQLKDKRQTLTRKGAELMKNVMKGLSDGTSKGFYWGLERLKFKKRKL